MKNKILYNALNEIDETYIAEAINAQGNGKRKRKYVNLLIPAAASILLIVITGFLFFQNYNGKNHERNVEPTVSDIKEHSFFLVAYASEDSGSTTEILPEESHEYILSSDDGKIANKFYVMSALEEMPDEMKSRIETAEECVVCFGLNVRIEGEEIETISFETEDTEFAKKIEYDRMQSSEKQKELFVQYSNCLGIGGKEYFDGCTGIAYENCGNTANNSWLFVPAGNNYTVPYEKQGDADYLYALKIVYDRKKENEAREYSYLHMDDEFQTINDFIINEIIGRRLKLTVNYTDGCKDEMILEIAYSGGRYMKVRIIELT